jgi:hypothetical protein
MVFIVPITMLISPLYFYVLVKLWLQKFLEQPDCFIAQVVAIGKKLLVMQWRHSAAWTAWCPASDTDTIDGFQYIRVSVILSTSLSSSLPHLCIRLTVVKITNLCHTWAFGHSLLSTKCEDAK